MYKNKYNLGMDRLVGTYHITYYITLHLTNRVLNSKRPPVTDKISVYMYMFSNID